MSQFFYLVLVFIDNTSIEASNKLITNKYSSRRQLYFEILIN